MKDKDKDKDGGFFEGLGRLLGYLDIMNISVLGILLMILGVASGFVVFDAERYPSAEGYPMVGSGLVSAGLLIAGAIMHAAKRIRK
jgi:hypothetical protein